jgi:hypothetical protein
MNTPNIPADEALCLKIRQLLVKEVQANSVSYNKETPYQSYERIGFEGLRWSVEKRVREYGLERFFDADASVLDIGSNFGFFVCEFALHCQLAHGIEPNPHLNQIGEITAERLGVRDRVEFYDCLFDEFRPQITYNNVFSFAAFFTQDGRERSDASNYFNKINQMLRPSGYVFYESTSYTKEPSSRNYSHFTAAESAVKAMAEVMTLEKTWETVSGSVGSFRRFAISMKKEN